MPRSRIGRAAVLIATLGIIGTGAASNGNLRGRASNGELPVLHLRGPLP